MDISKTIEEGLIRLEIPYEQGCPEKMAGFLNLMLEKNKVMNLTAITDPLQAVEKHMLDCAVIAKYADLKNKKMIDIGCGAGFPGVPIRFIDSSHDVTFLDSLGKRLNFIQEAFSLMNEPLPRIVHARAEEAAHEEEYREKFDVCFARAVAALNILSELCLPYVKVGGTFIAMKSTSSADELINAKEALAILGGQVEQVIDYELNPEISHRLILIKKVKECTKDYPRKFSQIKKMPL